MRLLFSALSISLLVSGCAGWLTPMGVDKYDCNRRQDPNSPFCRSYKSVNAATKEDLPDSRYDQPYSVTEIDELTGIAPKDQRGAKPPKIASSIAGHLPHQQIHARDQYPLSGGPVRVGPQIQRTWIKRYKDDRDMLTENTVVYKEVRGNRWAGFDEGRSGPGMRIGAYPHKPAIEGSAQAKTPAQPAPQEFSSSERSPESISEEPESLSFPR